ncbi:MAG: LapA family protein [Desulfovibrio sp.]|nr:LapA family protein [Desulfovibrio sp.]
MRYLKALVLAILIFLALVFFFQNQTALSQQLELSLNLFFIPPMTSIPLPFYFVVIAAFLVGALLSLALLFWDRFNTSAKLVKSRWHISSLEKELAKLKKDITGGESTGGKPSFFHRKDKPALAPAADMTPAGGQASASAPAKASGDTAGA